SRLRSEKSARTGVPTAVRSVDIRSDMIAPVMVMSRGITSTSTMMQALAASLHHSLQPHHQPTRDKPPEGTGNAGERNAGGRDEKRDGRRLAGLRLLERRDRRTGKRADQGEP